MDFTVKTHPSIRLATLSDAEAIGRLHVASWIETYSGILPEKVIHEHSVDSRTEMWKRILSQPGGSRKTSAFVAEHTGGLVGFGSCCGQRVQHLADDGFDAEISAIYVRQAWQGKGVGRVLMRAMACDLKTHGHTSASLTVLKENVGARQFYDRLGGSVIGQEQEDHDGEASVVLIYGWRDINRLIG